MKAEQVMQMRNFPELNDPARFMRHQLDAMRHRVNLLRPEPVVMRGVFGRFAPPADPAAPKPKPRLFGAKSFNSSSDAYRQRLTRRGFVELGRGAYSAVYAKPGSNRVIKVFHNGHEDDDWPVYAMWAQQQRSPYAIKVFSIKKYPTFYVAIMEKVNKAPGDVKEKIGDYMRYSYDRHYRPKRLANIHGGEFVVFAPVAKAVAPKVEVEFTTL